MVVAMGGCQQVMWTELGWVSEGASKQEAPCGVEWSQGVGKEGGWSVSRDWSQG